jgi:hypothetical protein
MRIFLFFLFILGAILSSAQTQKFVEFGKEIEKTIAARDGSFFNEAFDATMFLDRVTKTTQDGELDDFNNGFRKGFTAKFKMGDLIINEIGEGGMYSYLNHYEKDGVHHLLFRLFSLEKGLNYHDFELAVRDETIRIVDCYIFLISETLSTTFKRTYSTLLPQSSGSAEVDELKKEVEQFAKISVIKSHLSALDYNKALEVYNTVSDRYKTEKIFRLLKIEIERGIDDKSYMAAIDDYQGAFPGDLTIELISIDKYYLSKEFEKVLSSLDRIQASIKVKDPILHLYRGNCLFEMQKFKEAKVEFETLVKHYPTMETAHWSLAYAFIQLKEFSEAVDVLDRLNKDFGYDKSSIDELLQNEVTFIESENFKKWVAN